MVRAGPRRAEDSDEDVEGDEGTDMSDGEEEAAMRFALPQQQSRRSRRSCQLAGVFCRFAPATLRPLLADFCRLAGLQPDADLAEAVPLKLLQGAS